MTLDDINKAAETDEFIVKMKKQVQLNEKSKKDSIISPFSICSQTLMYADSRHTDYTAEEDSKRIP